MVPTPEHHVEVNSHWRGSPAFETTAHDARLTGVFLVGPPPNIPQPRPTFRSCCVVCRELGRNATIPHRRDTSQTSRPVGGPRQKMGKWDLDFSTVLVLEGFSSILGCFTTIQSTQIFWTAGFVPSNQK